MKPEDSILLDASRLRVTLEPLRPQHMEWLYGLTVNPDINWRWRFRGATPSPEAFSAAIWREVLAQFVLVERRTGRPFGLVQAYSHDMRARHCYVSVVIEPQLFSQGWPMQGVLAFVDYLFRTWEFHKLYFEALSFNAETFGSLIGRVLTQEGLLREHSRVHGAFVDLHILSLMRADWQGNPDVQATKASLMSELPTPQSIEDALLDLFDLDVRELNDDLLLVDDLGLDSLALLELSAVFGDLVPIEADVRSLDLGRLRRLLPGSDASP